MSAQTCYVALPFARGQDGCLIPKMQRDCLDAEEARLQARALGTVYAGAVAFSRDIDIEAGTTAGAILGVVGDVPNIEYLGLAAAKASIGR